MANYLSLFLSFFLFGCSNSHKLVSFKTYVRYSTGKNQNVKYTAKIPKGYTSFKVTAAGEYGTDKEYHYDDSSIIYISDNQLCDKNYENIQRYQMWSERFTYIKISSKSLQDTFKVEGIDPYGFYWKEVFIGRICIGYCKVNIRKKLIFDEAIQSFKGRCR